MRISEIPQLNEEFHPTKNGRKTPNDYTFGSGVQLFWLCKNGHEFQNSPNQRTYYGQNCPYCSGRRVTPENNLEVCFPEISSEWDYEKNGSLTPSMVHPKSMKRVYFKCKLNHSYKTRIQDRTQKQSDCPKCSNKTSRPEFRVFSEIKFIFPESLHRSKIKKTEVDILVPSIRVGIEYDGYYYHEGKEDRDTQKNEFLKRNGFHLIRLRQEPLKKISENDVLHPKRKYLLKTDLNDIFLKILKLVDLSQDQKNSIHNYVNQNNFQNGEHFQTYSRRPNIPKGRDSFLHTHPEFSQFWDYEKNHPLKPEYFTYGSNVEVYWRCNRGHSYKSSIDKKGIRGRGCPICQKIRSKPFIRKSRDPRQLEMKL